MSSDSDKRTAITVFLADDHELALDVLDKGTPLEDVVTTIRRVAAGEPVFGAEQMGELVQKHRRGRD